MKINPSHAFLFLGMLLFGLTSCKKDVEEEIVTEGPDYNSLLREILEEGANGEGLNFYVLPESHQYSLIPQDPLNPLNSAKVQLGKFLFHETGLARNPREEDGYGTYSCASCHHAQGGFQANMKQGIGEGGMGFGMAGEGRVPNPTYDLDSLDVQPLRTPTAMNTAYQDVMLWNGQFGATGTNEGTEDQWPMGTPIFNNQFGYQGLETQAIAGLTVHRMEVNSSICEEIVVYEELFDIAFSEFPVENRYTPRTAGLAIGAYERTLLANQSPWQDWLRGNTTSMSESEKRGAMLFFGTAECNNCHTGPALNGMEFHALGMDDMEGPGTYGGASSENTANLGRGSFTGNPDDNFKFKTPQLYNLKDSPFYGHGGTFNTVREVIEYKNAAIKENTNAPDGQLAEDFYPLELTNSEISDLVNFIENALYDSNLMRYAPDELPSGQCFPNNDPVSTVDQGCEQ